MADKVQQFLGDLEQFAPDKYQIIMQLRQLVDRICPKMQERIMYNGIVVYAGDMVCGYFPRKAHVTVELVRGIDLEDPIGVLEGTGKIRRHIKLRSPADISTLHLEDYLTRAFSLAATPNN